jgi:mannitol-specific phosphotransferase system IIBC component
MDEPSPLPECPPEVSAPPTTSLAARLLNVFAVPGDVFAEVKATPRSVGNWLVPTLLVLVLSMASAALIYSQPTIQQQLREQQDQVIQKMVGKGWINQEQAEAQRLKAGTSTNLLPFLGMAVVQAGVTPFGWGLILWLLGVLVFKAKFPFMKAVEVTGLASAITGLGIIVSTLMVVGLGNMFASPSPTLLLKHFDPQKPSHSLLAVVNVITFWVLVVRAIGLARLAGVPVLRAAFWVFGVWFAYMSLLLGIGMAVRAAFGI